MKLEHLRKLWTAIGTILAFYSLNAWITSQGGNPIFGVDLIEDGPRVGSLIAIPICSILLFVVCRIGAEYAVKSDAREWHARLPVVWLDELDTASAGGKWYQRFFLTTFVVLPSISLIHFIGKVLDAPVRLNQSTAATYSPLNYTPIYEIFSETYWIGGSIGDDGKLQGAVAWYPVVEPILFLLLVVVAWISVAIFFRNLFRDPIQNSC